MQLNELLEKHDINAIAQQTRIEKKSLENLFALNFTGMQKARALGFISILEREYKVDLSRLKSETKSYYEQNNTQESVVVGIPNKVERKNNPKVILALVATLLVLVFLYFLTKGENSSLQKIILMVDSQTIQEYLFDEQPSNPLPSSLEEEEEEVKDYHNLVSIVPMDKLWIGVINLKTLKKENFLIDKPYDFDISSDVWLIATSALEFSLVDENSSELFNDEEEHYFQIDKNSIQLLSKKAYLKKGGLDEW